MHVSAIAHVVAFTGSQLSEQLPLNRCTASNQIRGLVDVVGRANPTVVIAVVQTFPGVV